MKHYLFSTLVCLLHIAAVQCESAPMISDTISWLNSSDPAVRERAAFLLGRAEDPLVVDALIIRLQDPSEKLAVKLEIVTSLALNGSEACFYALTKTLKDSEVQQPETRALAAAALGAWREKRGLDPLLETLEDEKEPIVQWKILSALRKIGSDRGLLLIEQYAQPYRPPYIREEAQRILSKTSSLPNKPAS